MTSEEEAWRGIGLGAEVIELRLDLMEKPREGPALLTRLDGTGAPLIATNRPRREGGAWKESEEGRLSLLADAAGHAWAVDLESSTVAPARSQLRRRLRGTRTALILSRHDFRATPAPGTLRSWFSAMFRAGADVAKVAVTARRPEDLHGLLDALRGQRRPVVGIAMGVAGAPSRVMAGLFGSVLTYGCVDEPRAPGQMRVDRLRRMVESLHPERAGPHPVPPRSFLRNERAAPRP